MGHECGDSVDLIDGRPTGSVRVSFGLSSTVDDVSKLLYFIKLNFVEVLDGENVDHLQEERDQLLEERSHIDRVGMELEPRVSSVIEWR